MAQYGNTYVRYNVYAFEILVSHPDRYLEGEARGYFPRMGTLPELF